MQTSLYQPTMSINDIQNLIKDDFHQVNLCISKALSSEVVLINQLAAYIIHSGGKRLRPMITLLCAKAIEIENDSPIKAATLIEFIHTATLLHDDVVDHSNLRRGKKTANAIWGNEASVLVGDFLYTRAFQMMTELKSLAIMNVLAEATNKIAEGEVMQLLNIQEAEVSEADYMAVIYAKTAKLFEAAGHVAGLLADNPSPTHIHALSQYGKFVGTAFQLLDDILDYTADAETMGKNTGDDLAEGKPTLPFIYALRMSTPQEKNILLNALENTDLEALPEVLKIIDRTQALSYSYIQAQKQTQHAIESLHVLEDSVYKQALIALANYAVARKF